jgi:4-hydroxybenzoate-CoA ligase
MTGSNGNAFDYFITRHVREGRGERLAFADPWRRLSYADLAAASAGFAAGLRSAGIERERRIALVMLDTVDFPIAFWGALRAGIVPAPVNTLLPADIIGYILGDSRAAALVVSAPLLAPLRPALERLDPLGPGRIIVSAPDGGTADAPGTVSFGSFVEMPLGDEAPAECSPDEVAFWL